MPNPIEIIAPAKINLNLHVSAPIKDGKYKNYHMLDSLVAFANFGDKLFLENSDVNSIEIIGEFASELMGEDIENNLIFKAIKALNSYCQTQNHANIILDKRLPIASGIGGGSSDCAQSLVALNEIWQLGLSNVQLIEIGNKIGADIGVCIEKQAKIMRNIGDKLENAPKLPNLFAVLVNPLLPCPTPLIYKTFDELGVYSADMNANYFDCHNYVDAIKMLNTLNNDLITTAIKICPEIKAILELLALQKGADFYSMSGSGATCFAIFANQDAANNAATNIENHYKIKGQKIWVKPCQIMGN